MFKGWFEVKGNVFNIGNLAIPYDIEYSSKPGRIKVVMDIDGMSVRVPANYDIEELHKILDKKSNWIYNSYNELKVMKQEKYLRNWESGERALYKGRRYNLRFYEFDVNDVLIKFDGKKFKVNIPKNCDKEIIRLSFKSWYRDKAKDCILERLEYYSKIINVKFNRVTLKEQKTRWGSCSSKGNLNFNWKIIMSPQWVIDYVIVHEMCHLKHLNHSKDYWKMVSLHYPDYKKAVSWLKINGLSLNI